MNKSDRKEYNQRYYLANKEKKNTQALEYYYNNLLTEEYKKKKKQYDYEYNLRKKNIKPYWIFEVRRDVKVNFN